MLCFCHSNGCEGVQEQAYPYGLALVINFSTILTQFWWVIPLFVIAALLKSTWFKGVMGEVMVNLAARLFLDKNATIPTGDGYPFRGCTAYPKCRAIAEAE